MPNVQKMIAMSAITFIWSSGLFASDPYPNWGRWSIDAHSNGCGLSKTYHTSSRINPVPGYILADTNFYQVHARFSAHTFTHGNLITQDELGIIRFSLQFDPVSSRPPPGNKSITSATIGGISGNVGGSHGHQVFWFSEEHSIEILGLVERNERIDISLEFDDGTVRELILFPSLLNNGHVWVEMFKTCLAEHNRR